MKDTNLQAYVSKRLSDILEKLITDGHAEDKPLRINCSHAWVRWFHPSRRHWERLKDINRRVKDSKIEEETIENLTIWVEKHSQVTAS